MSYPADTRQNSGRKIVTHRPGISLAQTSSLRERFRPSMREKGAYFFCAKIPLPSLRRGARIRTKKICRVKDSLLRGWYPEKVPGRRHVCEPRRLTYLQGCLYSRSNRFAEWMRVCQTTAYVLLRRCLASLSACVWRTSCSGILYRGFRGDG
jgi:hypothetical protein